MEYQRLLFASLTQAFTPPRRYRARQGAGLKSWAGPRFAAESLDADTGTWASLAGEGLAAEERGSREQIAVN